MVIGDEQLIWVLVKGRRRSEITLARCFKLEKI